MLGPEAVKLVNPQFSTDQLGKEGIIICKSGEDLIIAGGSPRGTLYATYTFLEEHIGFRWWTSDAMTIPKPTSPVIPQDINIRYVPPLEYRWPLWTHINKDPDLAVRNKINGPELLENPKYGGNMSQGGVHTFYRLMPPKTYFSNHPEWFSLINGERDYKKAQLCLSNDAMRMKLVENLKSHISRNLEPHIYSVSQNDWAGYCECSSCSALAVKYGGQSGIMLYFVNQVADSIKDEYPDATLSTLAYKYTQEAPKNIHAYQNVIVQLCSIRCDFSVPLDHPSNQKFREDIGAWSKICDKLYIWDYVTNFRFHMIPHPNLQVLGPNIKFLVANNADGIFEQGAYTTAGAEFAELRGWVLAKLLWNPSLNGRKLIEEFADGYYGKNASPHILKYIDLMHEAVLASGEPLGIYNKIDAGFLNFKTLGPACSHLNTAISSVNHDPILLKRAEAARLPLLYTFLLKWDTLQEQAKELNATWPLPNDIKEVHKSFLKTAKDKGITQLHEGKVGFDTLERIVKIVAKRKR